MKYYRIMHTKISVAFSIIAIAAAVLLAGSGSVLAVGSNTGINVQTDINQKQECDTAGGVILRGSSVAPYLISGPHFYPCSVVGTKT